MTNRSRDLAETSVNNFFTLPNLGQVHQCLDPTMPQKWSDLAPWTRCKLTPMEALVMVESEFVQA